MPSLVVAGLQWGDEGKGRIVHALSRKSHLCCRYQGGNNAGHTLVFENGKIVILHLIPSGVVYPKVQCVIGNGMVVDPQALYSEIKTLGAEKISVKNRLSISELCHVILPYHTKAEQLMGESARIGTTQRGIGPAYKDKIARVGIRMIDFLDEELFEELVGQNVRDKLGNFLGASALTSMRKDICKSHAKLRKFFKNHVTDVGVVVKNALNKGKRVLFESAQATFLDIDFGTYPYVTSSNPVASAAPCGVGVGPKDIHQIMGVVKLFTTRVGGGPMPTEMPEGIAHIVREKGMEYGATTGRPRRVGYLDLTMVKKAARINGIDRLALTKLDTLSGVSPLKICVGYKFKGKTLTEFPSSRFALDSAKPIYKELPSFDCDVENIHRFRDLPKPAKKLVDMVEEYAGVKCAIVSTGRRLRNQVIMDPKFLKGWI
ncbi:adenylosuccinate synthase [Elusimicrobiota bacterium]